MGADSNFMLHKECSPVAAGTAEETTCLDRHPSSHSGRLLTCVMVLYPFTLSIPLSLLPNLRTRSF